MPVDNGSPGAGQCRSSSALASSDVHSPRSRRIHPQVRLTLRRGVTCQLPLPYQVRGTLCRLRAAWMEGRDEDLRCHIYQIRGAASWVCADRLLGATEELMRAYQERKCCDELEPQVLALTLTLTRP